MRIVVTGPGCGVLLLRYSLDVNAATLRGLRMDVPNQLLRLSFILVTMGVLAGGDRRHGNDVATGHHKH